MRHNPHQRSWWAGWGLGFPVLLALMITVGATGFRGSKMDESPKEIMGAWVTSDPRYQGCTLEITRYRIIFKNPLTRESENDIREVKKVADGARTLYEILYEDEEKMAGTMTFRYSWGKSGEIIQIRTSGEDKLDQSTPASGIRCRGFGLSQSLSSGAFEPSRESAVKLELRSFRTMVARRIFVLFVLCALLPISALAAVSYIHVRAQLLEQSQIEIYARKARAWPCPFMNGSRSCSAEMRMAGFLPCLRP